MNILMLKLIKYTASAFRCLLLGPDHLDLRAKSSLPLVFIETLSKELVSAVFYV